MSIIPSSQVVFMQTQVDVCLILWPSFSTENQVIQNANNYRVVDGLPQFQDGSHDSLPQAGIRPLHNFQDCEYGFC